MKIYKVYFWNGEHHNSVEETKIIGATDEEDAVDIARPLCDSLGNLAREDIEVTLLMYTDNDIEITIK